MLAEQQHFHLHSVMKINFRLFFYTDFIHSINKEAFFPGITSENYMGSSCYYQLLINTYFPHCITQQQDDVNIKILMQRYTIMFSTLHKKNEMCMWWWETAFSLSTPKRKSRLYNTHAPLLDARTERCVEWLLFYWLRRLYSHTFSFFFKAKRWDGALLSSLNNIGWWWSLLFFFFSARLEPPKCNRLTEKKSVTTCRHALVKDSSFSSQEQHQQWLITIPFFF